MNDRIYVAGTIALGAAKWLLGQRRTELEAIFPHFFLRQAEEMTEEMPYPEELDDFIASLMGSARYAGEIGGQGILSALWRMAEELGTGLEIRLRDIPIRQETVEILTQFDLNPYYSLSTGAVLIVTADHEGLLGAAAAHGLACEEIGELRSSIARTIRNGDSVRYLDRPQQEELMKVLTPPGGPEGTACGVMSQEITPSRA